MKNKEIEELLNKLKKCRDYDDEVLLIKQYGATLLLSYIEQLEKENKELKDIADEPIQIPSFLFDMTQELKIDELEKELQTTANKCKQLENTIDDMTNISYKDYDSWLKNKDYVKDLESFANQIDYDMHPMTTLAYRTSIKNAIKILVRRLKETYTEDTVNELKQENKQLENNRDKAIEVITNLKPLTEEETGIKEMLKLAYSADNIKNLETIFKTICHLEDFEIAIWNIKDILKGGSDYE